MVAMPSHAGGATHPRRRATERTIAHGVILHEIVYAARRPGGHAVPEDDAPRIAVVIVDARLCGECISRKTGLPRIAVQSAISVLRERLRVSTTMDPCESCERMTLVYQLGGRR
jgi:hypothetical protein